MFRTLCIIAALTSASAFSPATRITRTSRAFSTVEGPNTVEEAIPPIIEEESTPVVPISSAAPARLPAKWLPVGGVLAPAVLDGSLPGDVGFDKNKNSLLWMREAEIKHARLAMLAAVGWPLS